MDNDGPGCVSVSVFGILGLLVGLALSDGVLGAIFIAILTIFIFAVPASAIWQAFEGAQARKQEELRRERLKQERRDAARRKRLEEERQEVLRRQRLKREKELERRRVESHQLPEMPARRLIRDFSESEQLAAEWINHMGWPSATVTQPGQDSGLDVIGHNEVLGTVVAQVKMEGQKTGRPVLQNLAGAGRSRRHNAKHLMFFSLAGFSRGATEWADEEDIALFRFTADGSIQAENSLGQDYLRYKHLPDLRRPTVSPPLHERANRAGAERNKKPQAGRQPLNDGAGHRQLARPTEEWWDLAGELLRQLRWSDPVKASDGSISYLVGQHRKFGSLAAHVTAHSGGIKRASVQMLHRAASRIRADYRLVLSPYDAGENAKVLGDSVGVALIRLDPGKGLVALNDHGRAFLETTRAADAQSQ